MRNFPPAENSSITQFAKQRRGEFHHSQLLFCLLLFIFLFFNLPKLCWPDSLLLSSTRFEKIKLSVISAADDHTVPAALLSVFNSYLAHSAPLSFSSCTWMDFCRFISKLNCCATDYGSTMTWALCAVFCMHQGRKLLCRTTTNRPADHLQGDTQLHR